MKKPAPKGRTFDSDIPLQMAVIACSRMPKWKLRPPYEPASKSPAPSKVSRVFVEGKRSAAPPISHGTVWHTAFSTLPEESRVARPLGSAGEGASDLSPPA